MSDKAKTIVSNFWERHFSSIVVDEQGTLVALSEYEESDDNILLRTLRTTAGHTMRGYGTKMFVEGPLALSVQTGKPIKTIGLTDDGRAFYRNLERKRLITIDADPERSGVFTMRPVSSSLTTPAGTCYPDAWRYVMRHPEAVLAHGTAISLGKRIGHAWVELPDGTVWEPTSQAIFPIERFYALVDPIVEDRYTSEEAAIMVARVGKHGPWSAEERMKYIGR